MSQHQEGRIRRWGAVFGVVDLAIGPVQAQAQDPDQDASAAGDIVEARLGQVLEVDAPGLSGMDGDSLHPQ